MGPLAYRSIAGLLHFLLIFALFGTEILFFIIYRSEHCLVKEELTLARSSLAFPCFLSLPILGFPFFLLLSSLISVAIAHVTDDPSQIHNDEIILSTVQGVYVWRIDLRTVLINEVPRWKRWLSDDSECVLLFIHSQRC